MFHVLNRGVGRMKLFKKDEDYNAFERIIQETLEHCPMRICSYCLMPNHWHFLLWPEKDGDLARFMQRMTNKHVQRWQQHYDVVGEGHIYQARYKSFPIEGDDHFYRVARYVERNALRANLVDRAEDWPWNSLWCRLNGSPEETALLGPWPIPRSRHWLEYVNGVETEAELKALRRSVNKGQPYGSTQWVARVSKQLGLQSTLRGRGRPPKSRQ